MTRKAIATQLKNFGDPPSAQIIRLATALASADDAAVSKALVSASVSLPPQIASSDTPSPQGIRIDYRDACAAGGTASSLFNGELVRQAIMACARPGEPDFDDKAPFVIAAMQQIAPRNALEAMRASLAVAAHQAAMTAYKVARSCPCPGELATVFSARADRAAVVADALIEAIERGRGNGAQDILISPERASEK